MEKKIVYTCDLWNKKYSNYTEALIYILIILHNRNKNTKNTEFETFSFLSCNLNTLFNINYNSYRIANPNYTWFQFYKNVNRGNSLQFSSSSEAITSKRESGLWNIQPSSMHPIYGLNLPWVYFSFTKINVNIAMRESIFLFLCVVL